MDMMPFLMGSNGRFGGMDTGMGNMNGGMQQPQGQMMGGGQMQGGNPIDQVGQGLQKAFGEMPGQLQDVFNLGSGALGAANGVTSLVDLGKKNKWW